MPKRVPRALTPRQQMIAALDTMPDEALGWVAIALATRIFPDGLGGFMPDSRASIVAAKQAANAYIETSG